MGCLPHVLVIHYSQAAPTMINKMNSTTINAKPPPYPAPIYNTPFLGIYLILFKLGSFRLGKCPDKKDFCAGLNLIFSAMKQ
jgi:hypothetical protein